ncbi:metal dependent phosphohydrolase [Fusarium sporotrichioides]|uniref:Metal dependent phosphohydrolase n=1 Tax=Fusarium sporotrichioides TaxID=5514 RepID=A0A395S8P3_FUSSP|nr:metal dependent phosphohydrolase [Fusarium sporotrichioides]
MNSQSGDMILPDIPEFGLIVPSAALAASTSSFVKKHCDAATHNHSARSAYWALILARKLPQFANVDLSLVFISCMLHDMGWAVTKELLAQDKRFEVDGANIAKEFLKDHSRSQHLDKETVEAWDPARIQRAWDAIALHTTPSIAQHAAAEVALTNLGITADFLGPNLDLGFGPNLISIEEYRVVMKLFPRSGFTYEGLKQVLCGICKTKPSTTYDNFVGEFGVRFGIDGEGSGKGEFAEEVEKARFVNFSKSALDALEALDKEILGDDK